jgi:hypothetical protein
MFRIGGQVNEDGIVSMAVPKRAHYADPTGAASTDDNYDLDQDALNKDAARRAAILSQYVGTGRSQDERLSDLLIRGGLNAVSGVGAGRGSLAGLAASFRQPAEEFIKGSQEEQALQRQIKLGAATTAMSSADAQALQRLKIKAMYANQTAEAMTERWAKEFSQNKYPGIAENSHAAASEVVNFMKKNPNEPTPRIVGPTGPKDKNGNPTWLPRDLASIAEGDVYFNPTTFKIEKKTKAGPVVYNRVSGVFEAPIASAKPEVQQKPVNTPDARTWNKQRFWEEFYKNNPKEKTKQTAEAPINTDTDIG